MIGRTKAESVELDPRPADSHVASTDQDTFGHILRRNMAYGTVTDHGTMFVGFAAGREPLQTMLESMAGLKTGSRDALTQHEAGHRRVLRRPVDRVDRGLADGASTR